MLKENIKSARKSKGLSQEELAIKLNVVRQTISKWEQGLSVPDCEMLISISETLDTSVSVLLGENVSNKKEDDLKVISEKLEIINLQLSQRKIIKRKIAHWIMVSLAILIVIIFAILVFINGSYLNWNYNNPENAVLGVFIHSFEWAYIRMAPFALIALIIGIILTRKK